MSGVGVLPFCAVDRPAALAYSPVAAETTLAAWLSVGGPPAAVHRAETPNATPLQTEALNHFKVSKGISLGSCRTL
jgi:hypothetical protein